MKTVYIVGAGASHEIGLPLGQQLKGKIAKAVDCDMSAKRHSVGDEILYRRIRSIGPDSVHYFAACDHIVKNMPLAMSIDNFIDANRDNRYVEIIGKYGIVSTILDAERRSEIFFDVNDSYLSRDGIQYSGLENTWYLKFFRSITENCTKQNISKRFSQISLIIFNYDRCVEHFLFEAIKSYYKVDDIEAAQLLSHIEFIHPYGSVGMLPWQNNSNSSVAFGKSLYTDNIFNERISDIKTFTESCNPIEHDKIKSVIQFSERIVFLGFAFHRINMELLSSSPYVPYIITAKKKIYCTAFKSSSSDQEAIQSAVQYLFNGPTEVHVASLTCSDFFNDYSRSLSYYPVE